MYWGYNTDTIQYNRWRPTYYLIHELGHNLGLLHPFDGNDGCDDTPTPAELGCETFRKDYDNNYMNYHAGRFHLSACQQARMRWHLLTGQRNLGSLLTDDHCHTDSSLALRLPDVADDTIRWTGLRYVAGPVTVPVGTVLRIDCPTYWAAGAGLTIERGGALVLGPNATMEPSCGGAQWPGIQTPELSARERRRHTKQWPAQPYPRIHWTHPTQIQHAKSPSE
jgi:hypothetical protein